MKMLKILLFWCVCFALTNAEPEISKIEKFLGYLNEVASFLRSLSPSSHLKQEVTQPEKNEQVWDIKDLDSEKDNTLEENDSEFIDIQNQNMKQNRPPMKKMEDKPGGKDYDHYIGITMHQAHRTKSPSKYKEEYQIDPTMTKRCLLPYEKRLITSFLITYKDNETSPGFDCTHTSWRLYSHVGKLQITPIFLAVERPHRFYHSSGKIESSLVFYDGFDHSSSVLFETKGDSKSYQPVTTSKKRVFIKFSSNNYPSGWKFMLKIDVIPLKDNFLNPSIYENYSKNPAKNKAYATEKNSNPPNQPVNMKNPQDKNHLMGMFMNYHSPFKHPAPLESMNSYNKEQPTNYLPLNNFPQNNNNNQPINTPPHKKVIDFTINRHETSQKEHEKNKNGQEKRFNHSAYIPGLNLSGDRKLVEGCSGKPMLLWANKGFFYSPNYLLNTGYPSNSNCSWKITVDPGKVIMLEFMEFSIEPPFTSTSLCFDDLKIFDGPEPTPINFIGTYCGDKAPKNFVSTSNQLFITFSSDNGERTYAGFFARYTSKSVVAHNTLNPQCGVPKIQPNIYSRIVGGEEARPHSWPWQISFQYEGNHICGGCLLTSRWAITAAHCLVDLKDINRLFLRFGEHNLTKIEGSEETRQVGKHIIHPNYNSNTNDFDLALIYLDEEVTITDYILPACLPKNNVNYDTLICVVAGWGITKETDYNVILNQLTVGFINSKTCNEKTWYNGKVTKNMFCAGYEKGRRDSCQGDSGGPLVCSDGKDWSIYGVISWGFDCAMPHRPGVYTNVTLLWDWIVQEIREPSDRLWV